MISKKLYPLLFISLVLLISLVFVVNSQFNNPVDESFGAINSSKIQKAKFYDEKLFFRGVAKTEEKNKKSDYRIKGGIIPHDLLPSFIISDFFSRLATQNPKTIVIIGPNHYELGDSKFLASMSSWETPFGIISSNKKIINKLIEEKLVTLNDEALLNDHAVGSSLPYIKYYISEANVVPILVSGFTNQKEADVLADNLKKMIDEDIVIIAAVDFSHYLNSEQAKEKDKITYEIIKKYDYENLFMLNNDYVDSPASIGILLMLMQKLGNTNMDMIYNTNSGVIQENDFIETTSYFSITYH